MIEGLIKRSIEQWIERLIEIWRLSDLDISGWWRLIEWLIEGLNDWLRYRLSDRLKGWLRNRLIKRLIGKFSIDWKIDWWRDWCVCDVISNHVGDLLYPNIQHWLSVYSAKGKRPSAGSANKNPFAVWVKWWDPSGDGVWLQVKAMSGIFLPLHPGYITHCFSQVPTDLNPDGYTWTHCFQDICVHSFFSRNIFYHMCIFQSHGLGQPLFIR